MQQICNELKSQNSKMAQIETLEYNDRTSYKEVVKTL